VARKAVSSGDGARICSPRKSSNLTRSFAARVESRRETGVQEILAQVPDAR
jgi:hypothetical protein